MIWYWIQEFNTSGVFPNKKKSRIDEFIIDERTVQIGDTDDAWLWVALEPIHNRILGVSIISRHRYMPVAESFLRSLIKLYGKHIVYSDMGSWYPEACNSRLKHIFHTQLEKSIIERAMEYINDRTEAFDDYYPCRKKAVDCNNLAHVYQWFVLFVFLYNLSKSQSKINIIKFLMRSGKILNLTQPYQDGWKKIKHFHNCDFFFCQHQ
jgi:putative transposase